MTATEPSLPFDAPASRKRRPSLTDKLERFFRAHPGEWISLPDMAAMVGVSGVRQRRLEVEKRGVILERKAWTDEYGRHHLAYRNVAKVGERSAA